MPRVLPFPFRAAPRRIIELMVRGLMRGGPFSQSGTTLFVRIVPRTVCNRAVSVDRGGATSSAHEVIAAPDRSCVSRGDAE
jgi:hypothetical protein